MARPKSEWAQPWKTVAKRLSDVSGGTWPSVLCAIEAKDGAALASWFPGQLSMKKRRDLANRQIGTWGTRGTAPNPAIAHHVVTLVGQRLPEMVCQIGDPPTEVSAVDVLLKRLAEDGQHLDRSATSRTDGNDQPARRSGVRISPLLTIGDRKLRPRLSRSRLTLGAAHLPAGNGLVAIDATFIAAPDGELLHVARVNRVTGKSVQWQELRLAGLGDGSVLAIGGASHADVVFVWAGERGTALYRGHQQDGAVELVETLDSVRASEAVLHGVRALLSFPDHHAGGETCEAFPELIITSMVGAASDGRLVVLAVGADLKGNESAWIEVDGRHRQRVPVGAGLELPLGNRSFPILRGADDATIEVSPPPTTAQPYQHWLSPLLIGQAASA